MNWRMLTVTLAIALAANECEAGPLDQLRAEYNDWKTTFDQALAAYAQCEAEYQNLPALALSGVLVIDREEEKSGEFSSGVPEGLAGAIGQKALYLEKRKTTLLFLAAVAMYKMTTLEVEMQKIVTAATFLSNLLNQAADQPDSESPGQQNKPAADSDPNAPYRANKNPDPRANEPPGGVALTNKDYIEKPGDGGAFVKTELPDWAKPAGSGSGTAGSGSGSTQQTTSSMPSWEGAGPYPGGGGRVVDWWPTAGNTMNPCAGGGLSLTPFGLFGGNKGPCVGNGTCPR
jgi:hypothetical protein